ncbi:MAG TPA: 1-(5-phosphoribosyl)-5-[(5-phosphoribosylamino)methylideneamino] imidazole-4-carboxamide isomerase [Steroidobacteraceae bacterium]|jgi:phosphoribosylformimino-5-aminoimidazole carboxamide ribotide isomerase|nr:1-(5-phosphoribosyl)-5-[(5-phosphoribosylamino)methylideneamino] imidazole-4-carboxamide isomerase [Steroidobacteraceae bacterium]
MLLIPSIDLRGGKCVRLLKGDFTAETCYEFGALELMWRYRQLGAAWLHLVDLDAARDGTLTRDNPNRAMIQQLAAPRALALQVGGGLRSRAALEALFAIGVARAVIGSAAVEQRAEVAQWLSAYGPERICLAFDVRMDAQQIPRLRIRGWQQGTDLSLWDAVESFRDSGLKHVLCTDIECDGALAGPNLALYEEALRRFPDIRWQASGGVSTGADLIALAAHGVPAAISGRALLEARISSEELRPFLPNA